MIIFAYKQTHNQADTNSKTEAHSNPLWIVGERANNIYFDFRSVTRFTKIWLETRQYLFWGHSKVNVMLRYTLIQNQLLGARWPGLEGSRTSRQSRNSLENLLQGEDILSTPMKYSWSFSHLPLPWMWWVDSIKRCGGHGGKLRWNANFGASHDIVDGASFRFIFLEHKLPQNLVI